MKISKCIRTAFLLAISLPLLAQNAPLEPTALPIGSAVVSEVKGELVVTSPQGTPVVAQRGATLVAESRIETAKGTLLLELQDGSQVLIKAHSNVVLKAPNEGNGYSLELFIGKIMAKVQKRLGGAPSFRMGTPSAVITVRGTRFGVEVNKKRKTFVDVFEGLVDVSGVMEGSPHILLRPGFYTGVDVDRNPEGPREMTPGEGSGREGAEGREDSRDRQGSGKDQSREDQQRNQTQPRTQNSDGKPD
jgi:ferric-dicitrate binding protein FerR (iron transport regulator)